MTDALVRVPHDDSRPTATHSRITEFLTATSPDTPCLVVDLETVRDRYRAIRAALPEMSPFYAVKANPAPQVIDLLVREGSGFDVAGVAEVDLCLNAGATPDQISYGNPIKKPRDIAAAYSRGIRTFVSDSITDVRAIAESAPGSAVLARIMVHHKGSPMPFGQKFGCTPDHAAEILRLADRLGLEARGVAFHPGSQQLDPTAWDSPIELSATIFAQLRAEGIELTVLNLGGGFPARYRQPTPQLSTYGRAIRSSVATHFGPLRPRLMIEPGRAIVAEAGLIRSEVILVTQRDPDDPRRWVYLDVGRYGGLAETEGEAIAYCLQTGLDGGPTGPVVIAGPTCDGDDVLYQHTDYHLPIALTTGDRVDVLAAGAYTASYASVEFNGFAPLPTYCI